MTRGVWCALAMSLVSYSCGDGNPTSPDDTSAISTARVVFEGTLEQAGSSFYSFTVLDTGAVTINLASLSPAGRREALAIPVRVGVGTPQGVGCGVAESVEATPALVSQFSTQREPGIYCVDIADAGSLPGPVDFVIRFTHP